MACFLTRRARLRREISTLAQGKKHSAKMWRFWLSFHVKLTINFVLQTVLFSWNQTSTEIFHGDVKDSTASVKLLFSRPLEIERHDWTVTYLLSFDQSFSLVEFNRGLFPDSMRTTYTRDLHSRFLGKHRAKKVPFLTFLPDLPSKINNTFCVTNSFIQWVSNFHRDNMVRRKCKHCPVPGCHSKFLVRLANHLTRVHELTETERKYWLQFAKLQNTNVVCVCEKEDEPKTIFSINQRKHNAEMWRFWLSFRVKLTTNFLR